MADALGQFALGIGDFPVQRLTVAIMQESGNPDGSEPTVVDHVPEADALVSDGVAKMARRAVYE